MAMTAIPPTTPPTIGPVFDELFVDEEEVETGIEVVVDISVVMTIVDPSEFVEVIMTGTVVATDVMEVVVGVVLANAGVVEACALLPVVVEDVEDVGVVAGVVAEVDGVVDVGVVVVDGVVLVAND